MSGIQSKTTNHKSKKAQSVMRIIKKFKTDTDVRISRGHRNLFKLFHIFKKLSREMEGLKRGGGEEKEKERRKNFKVNFYSWMGLTAY